MTCGIYKLVFNNTHKVYVGQSVRIENRFQYHTSLMKNNLASIKLTEAFTLYGIPQLVIIEECDQKHLDSKEIEYISFFNSVLDGFNTRNGGAYGTNLAGELHPNSKYSNQDIIEVFLLLIKIPTLTLVDIGRITSVSVNVIENISSLKGHTWLKDTFPVEYELLQSLKGKRINSASSAAGRGIMYPPILSPDNVEYNVSNAKAFSLEHNLNHSHLVGVLNGKRNSHKGWRVLK